MRKAALFGLILASAYAHAQVWQEPVVAFTPETRDKTLNQMVIGGVADANGDGLDDFLVGNHLYSEVWAFMSNAAVGGGFDVIRLSHPGALVAGPASLQFADIDQDGDMDVIGTGKTPGASPGASWFQLAYPLQPGAAIEYKITSTFTEQLQVMDFNDDGYPDIAVVDSSNACRLYLNPIGTGGLAAAWRAVDVGRVEGRMAVGDSDGDGKPEVIFRNDGSLEFFEVSELNNGVPVFTKTTAQIGTSKHVWGLVDLDGDSDLDVILEAGALQNLGGGTFSYHPFPLSYYSVTAGDVDADGMVEIVGVFASTGGRILERGEGFTFTTASTFRVNPIRAIAYNNHLPIQLVNVLGDSRPSLLTGGSSVWMSHSNASPPIVQSAQIIPNPAAPEDVVPGTGTLRLEIMAADGSATSLRVLGVAGLMPLQAIVPIPASDGTPLTIDVPVRFVGPASCESRVAYRIFPEGDPLNISHLFFADIRRLQAQTVVVRGGELPIPDFKGGDLVYTTTLGIPSGSISRVRMQIEIEHSYRGDLLVTSTGSLGTTTLFRGDSTDSGKTLRIDRTLLTSPASHTRFTVGFTVRDQIAGDTGIVKSFRISVDTGTTVCTSDLATILDPFVLGWELAVPPDPNGDGVYDAADVLVVSKL